MDQGLNFLRHGKKIEKEEEETVKGPERRGGDRGRRGDRGSDRGRDQQTEKEQSD